MNLENFNVNKDKIKMILKKIYLENFRAYSEIEIEFDNKLIDQIDTTLVQHYNFTEEELDFIINYDIKYHMGKELDAYIEGTLGNQSMENKE